MSNSFWLLKAEPEQRVVKGKDVKFSVDDFEAVKTSPWEGVRNHEAKNLMLEMKVGDKALFYHSNCKNPGVAAFAEVSREAYPDHTAWDLSHPYYDPKTDQSAPKWFMVDLTFKSRATHFVPLTILKFISTASPLPKELEYIGESGANAIKSMDLITRGRLSVQKVDAKAWEAIQLLADNGGWENVNMSPRKRAATKAVNYNEDDEDEDEELPTPSKPKGKPKGKGPGRPKAKPKPKIYDEEDAWDDDEVSASDFDDAGSGDDYGSAKKRASANGKRKAKKDPDGGDYRSSAKRKSVR